MATFDDASLLYGAEDSLQGNQRFDPASVLYYPTAVVADIFKSVANSFIIGEDNEFDTQDILNKVVGTGAGDFYARHRSSVELGSFAAGIFLPGKMVSTVAKLAKSGKVLGIPLQAIHESSYFNNKMLGAGKTALDALKTSGAASAEYKAALKSMNLWKYAAGAAEGAVMEAEAVLLYNGHSYFDNYGLEDFALGAGIGAVAGVGVKTLVQNAAMRNAAQKIQADVLKPAVDTASRAWLTGNQGLTVGAHATQLKEQRLLLADGSLSPEARSIAEASELTTARAIKSGLMDLTSDELLTASEKVASKDAPPLDFMAPKDFPTPLEVLGQAVLNDPGVLIGVGTATKGTRQPAITKFTRDKILNPELSIETGARVLDNGTIEADDARTLLAQMNIGTQPLPSLEAADELAAQLTVAPTIRYSAVDQTLTIDGLDYTQGAHKALLATHASLTPPGTKFVLTNSVGTKEAIDAIHAARKDPGTLAIINDAIDTEPLTLDELTNRFGFTFGRAKAVLDSWFGGPKIFDDREARLLIGAAEDSNYRPDFNYFAGENARTWAPQTQSVLQADKEFLNANHSAAANLLKVPLDLTIETGDLARLQAAYLAARESNSALNITIGDRIITDQHSLLTELINTKLVEIRTGLDAGHSMERMAKATNTPLDTVQTFVDGGLQYRPTYSSMTPKDLMVYNSLKQNALDYYLKPKMLHLDGQAPYRAQQEELRKVIQLDAEHMKSVHEGIVDNIVRAHAPESFQSIYDDILNTDEFKGLEANLEQLVTTEGSGSRFISSVDHTLRGIPGGEVITLLGARTRSVLNEKFKAIAGHTIHAALTKLSAEPAVRTQYYMILNAMDELSNADATGMKIVQALDPTGNTINKIELVPATKEEAAKYLTYPRSNTEISWNPGTALDDAMSATKYMSDEALKRLNTNRQLAGMQPIAGRGIHAPYASIDDQFTGYVVSTNPKKVADIKIIVGKDLNDFESKLTRAQQELDPAEYRVLRSRDQLADWNDIHSYAKLDQLERWNPAQTKSGITSEQIPNDNSRLNQLLEAYHQSFMSDSRLFMQRAKPDIFDKLDGIAKAQKAPATSIKRNLFTRVQEKPKLADIVANTLLNRSDLPNSPWFNSLNNTFSAGYTMAARKVTNLWDTTVGEYKNGKIPLERYNQIQEELKNSNIPFPWKDFTDYAAARVPEFKDISQEHIAKANSLVVTLGLRLFDLSHAAVTLMSAPLMMSAEAANVAKSKSIAYPIKYMYRGLKMLTNPTAEEAAFLKTGERFGHTARQVEGTISLFDDIHLNISKWGPVQESRAMKFLTKPADWSEEITRKWAYATGYHMAKDAYQGATQGALEAYAVQFANRTMGNYLSRQRPTLFQGSLGAAVGLYQTFMLTMTQNMFRYIEAKDLRALTTLAAGWQGMFGIQSLPLYEPMNKMIGRNAETTGHDLTNAIYEQFGDTSEQSRSMAEYLLYGVPSALFQVPVQSRATIDPRLPFTAQDGAVSFKPALVSIAYQAGQSLWDTGSKLASVASAGGDALDYGRAIGEGISSQAVWRPGARAAELLLGRSVDQTGATVSTTDEVYQPWAVIARVASSRPMKEQALRNLRYNGRYYDAVSRESRRDTIKALRSMVVDGTSGDQVGTLMSQYINKGGTIRGFNQALQGAYMGIQKDFAGKLADDIDADSPVGAIIRTYGY